MAARGRGRGLREVAEPEHADVVAVRGGEVEVAARLAHLADGREEGAVGVVQAADHLALSVQLQHQPLPREQLALHLRWGAL